MPKRLESKGKMFVVEAALAQAERVPCSCKTEPHKPECDWLKTVNKLCYRLSSQLRDAGLIAVSEGIDLQRLRQLEESAKALGSCHVVAVGDQLLFCFNS
jgi:hypothetical protein